MQITSQAKAKLKIASIYALIVGAAFWIPDIIVHGFSGKSFSSPEVHILTIMLPLVGASSLYIVRKIREYKDSQVIAILSGVFGIWITGPFFMMISSSFSGGGFARSDGGFFEQISFVVTCTVAFPIFTFMMSTYDGTLFALFIASGLVPLAGLLNRKQ